MIIAFDVTDRVASVSWLTAAGNRGRETVADRKATEILVPMLESLQHRHEEPLTRVGVVVGPGSFTGIRVGLATALGLKAALNIPVYGYNKLELTARRLGENPAVLLLPAGRGHVMVCKLAGGAPAGEPEIRPMGNLEEGTDYLVPTPIDGVSARQMDTPFTDILCEILAEDETLSEADHPLTPLYVRPPDARVGTTLIDRLLKAKN